MPISIQEAKARTATVDVYSRNAHTGGLVDHTGMEAGDLLVTYRIVAGTSADEEAKISQELQAIATRTRADEGTPEDLTRQAELYAELIVRQVVSWDLSLVPGGPPIPIERAAIAQQVPTDIGNDVIDAIAAHKHPAKNNGARLPRR